MSTDRSSPSADWRHGGALPEEPPGLHVDPRSKPGVEELLGELSKGLKPGEDPLFYELPDGPDDPEACAPDEARVYVGPTAPPAAHHKTLEMERVKVAARVDPRRAVTQRVQMKRAADPKEDAPPMSGPASADVKSDAGRKRTAAAVVLGLVAVAVVVLAAMRGPKLVKEEEKAPPTATVPNAVAVPSMTVVPTAPAVPSATAPSASGPSATAAPSATASVATPPGTAAHRAKTADDPNDPYSDVVPSAKKAPPAPTSPQPYVEERPEF